MLFSLFDGVIRGRFVRWVQEEEEDEEIGGEEDDKSDEDKEGK